MNLTYENTSQKSTNVSFKMNLISSKKLKSAKDSWIACGREMLREESPKMKKNFTSENCLRVLSPLTPTAKQWWLGVLFQTIYPWWTSRQLWTLKAPESFLRPTQIKLSSVLSASQLKLRWSRRRLRRLSYSRRQRSGPQSWHRLIAKALCPHCLQQSYPHVHFCLTWTLISTVLWTRQSRQPQRTPSK